MLLVGLTCLVMLPTGLLQGQGGQAITYHGIRASDPGGRQALRNPERGWRIETVIAEPHQKVFIGPANFNAKDRQAFANQLDRWLTAAKS